MQTTWLRFGAIGLLGGLLIACGGKTTVESDLGIKGAPDWVNEGSNILNDKGGRLVHGVGSAPQMGDQSLQVSTADERARAEVARVLSSYMNVVSKDYIASVQGSTGSGATEQSVSRDISNITKLNLTGARIIGHWRDKKVGTVYSLAELDMKQVQETVNKVEDMNKGFKEFLQSKGDNIFDGMAKGGK